MKGFPGGSAGIESCNARDPSSFPGWRRSPGEGNGNPLQKVKVLVAQACRTPCHPMDCSPSHKYYFQHLASLFNELIEEGLCLHLMAMLGAHFSPFPKVKVAVYGKHLHHLKSKSNSLSRRLE